MPELSILVPVYNELDTVEAAIGRLAAADVGAASYELIVVDDGSSDGTGDLLSELAEQHPQMRLLRHTRNLGKGAAMRTGLASATGRWATVMDADLEYEPSSIARLLEPLQAGDARAVYGSRGFESHSAFGFWYVIGNKGVTMATNVLFDSWLADIMTCHKAIETELFQSLALRENGFGIEAEITARLLRAGVRIHEVPVTYRARSREEGKKLTALDGVRVLRTLVRCRLFDGR